MNRLRNISSANCIVPVRVELSAKLDNLIFGDEPRQLLRPVTRPVPARPTHGSERAVRSLIMKRFLSPDILDLAQL
jgi:hypothetical protein